MNMYKKGSAVPAVDAPPMGPADFGHLNALQRGQQQAAETERRNVQHALDSALADLKRLTATRDTTTPARDVYDRCYWTRVVPTAERLAMILDDGTGRSAGVEIPEYLPPPVPTQATTVRICAPRASEAYRESKGLGPSGEGLPLSGPGSNTDPNWVQK